MNQIVTSLESPIYEYIYASVILQNSNCSEDGGCPCTSTEEFGSLYLNLNPDV